MDAKIIVLYQLYPSPLSHIQLLLRKAILEALVISLDITPISDEIVAPSFESMNYDN
jgi:hypothetical protein